MAIFDARARLTLLCAYDSTQRALTEKILERPRLVERIRAAIGDPASAYLTVFNATPLERRLAIQLGIPMNAADPELAPLASKSGSRRTFREAGVALPYGFEDIHSIEEIVAALHSIRAHKPDVSRAVLKFNEGFSGEGNAVFDFPEPGAESDIRAALYCLRLAVGSDSAAYLTKFCQLGGVVEEFIDAHGRTSPSVQLRINPRREVILASSHEQILGGPDQQVFVGCRFPADDHYRVAIQEAALIIGGALAEKGVLGRLSIDFLAWPSEHGWQIAALETNLRMGGTTHPMLALQFLTGGRLDAASGAFHGLDGRTKFYRASDNVESPDYRGLLPEDLMEITVKHRLGFNHQTGTGVLFHLIGAISQYGKVGLTAIGNSREEAEQMFERTIQVLDQETSGSAPATEQIHRDEAIASLRKSLIEKGQPGQSICQMAAQQQIFCHGFGRYTDEQLRATYGFLDSNQPRAKFELKANAWQIRRQVESGMLTCCDAQWQYYETCRGWDDFTNDQLAEFCAELMGGRFEVVGEKTLAVL